MVQDLWKATEGKSFNQHFNVLKLLGVKRMYRTNSCSLAVMSTLALDWLSCLERICLALSERSPTRMLIFHFTSTMENWIGHKPKKWMEDSLLTQESVRNAGDWLRSALLLVKVLSRSLCFWPKLYFLLIHTKHILYVWAHTSWACALLQSCPAGSSEFILLQKLAWVGYFQR